MVPHPLPLMPYCSGGTLKFSHRNGYSDNVRESVFIFGRDINKNIGNQSLLEVVRYSVQGGSCYRLFVCVQTDVKVIGCLCTHSER